MDCKALVTVSAVVLDPSASGRHAVLTTDREYEIAAGVGEILIIDRGAAVCVEGVFSFKKTTT